MITVAGEALVDLIVAASGAVEARLGGGPYNVARAVARLGQPAAFLGRVSRDGFGSRLRAGLDDDGVCLVVPLATAAPTTLAVADLGPGGVPCFRFYLDGTSAVAVEPGSAVLPADTAVFYTGALGLVTEPIALSIELLAGDLRDGILLVVDPNCRPAAIKDRALYLGRLGRVLRRADLVKTSTEDLAYMYPGASAEDAVRELFAAGGPRAVVVTDGPAPVRVFTAGSPAPACIPVRVVEVVDTVGAGDAFGGALIAWWAGHGLGRAALEEPDLLCQAARAAAEAAVITCTRVGADPPRAGDLAGLPGWEWLPA